MAFQRRYVFQSASETLSSSHQSLFDRYVLRDLGFSGRGGGLVARQFKHLLHVRQVFLPRLRRLGIVFDVVVTIRQRNTALVDEGDGRHRVVHVGLRVEGE